MLKRTRILAMIVVALACALFALPATAQAASPTIHTPTTAENKAYNRCVRAAEAYATKPDVIKVSVKDLGLTRKQLDDVKERVHSNGELWYINTFAISDADGYIIMPCKYSDATTASMQKKFEAAVATALKRIGPGMTGAAKVHMLHDYIIRKVDYQAHCKNAYDALVTKKADCFGYTLGMDVLMRRAGYTTDLAYNSDPDVDHCWNLVKLSGNWYHVDVTWDRHYTRQRTDGKVDHRLLLQSDKAFNQDTHKGWRAHHRCTTQSYRYAQYTWGPFAGHCGDYKNIVRSFSKSGLKYRVSGVKKVYLTNVNTSKRSASKLTVPATVTYKNVTYKVVGIDAKAFAKASAKRVVLKTTALAKTRVKNSLAGSKVTRVYVPKGRVKAYKSYFAKANSGKSVKVIAIGATTTTSTSLSAQSLRAA